jgi:glycosyltransferase involved in cell wall biosynthesis
MKVLLIAGSFNQGGAEYQILTLAELLHAKGNEVYVVALTDYDFYKPYLNEHSIPFHCLKNSDNSFKRIWQTSRFIKKFKPESIITFMKVPSMATIIARMMSGVTCTLLLSERTALVMPLRDFFHFTMWHFADVITTNSVTKVDYFKRNFPLLYKKLHLITNIYGKEKLELPLPIRLSASGDTFNFVFIGRVSPEKNLLILCKALARLKASGQMFVFNLYGDTRNATHLLALKQLIQQLELEENIVFHGPVPASALKEIYNQADLVCLLSEYEGFSNVLAEVLINGSVALASNIPENAFIIQDDINGFLVDNKSIDSIFNGLMKFISISDQDRYAMKLRNRERALGMFDREKVYHQFMKLLNKQY